MSAEHRPACHVAQSVWPRTPPFAWLRAHCCMRSYWERRSTNGGHRAYHSKEAEISSIQEYLCFRSVAYSVWGVLANCGVGISSCSSQVDNHQLCPNVAGRSWSESIKHCHLVRSVVNLFGADCGGEWTGFQEFLFTETPATNNSPFSSNLAMGHLHFRCVVLIVVGLGLQFGLAAVQLGNLQRLATEVYDRQLEDVETRLEEDDELRDSLLPVELWRRARVSINSTSKGRHLQGYLRRIGAPECDIEQPETCKCTVASLIEQFVLAPMNSIVEIEHRRHRAEKYRNHNHSDHYLHNNHHHSHHSRRRRRRHVVDDEQSYGPGKPISFRFLNAVPREANVSLALIPNQQGHLPGRMNLTTEEISYGVALNHGFPLILDDTFGVSSISEKHSADVRDSIFRVPHQSEFFVVADLTNNSRLHSSLAIFDLNVSYSDAWFFSYNALHTGDGSSYPGLDVLMFDASKVGQGYSLLRIARNIQLHQGQESTLPTGEYEVKVVPTGSILTVNGFKNTQSLVPPIFVKVDINYKRYNYLVINGDTMSHKFPPKVTTLPNIEKGLPPPPLPTRTTIINSDPTNAGINISFSFCEYSVELPAGQGAVGNVTVRKNDKIILRDTDTNENYTFPVGVNVPYMGGACVIFTDRSRVGKLEGFFTCWEDRSHLMAPQQAWFFTYNALVDYDGEIEVIIRNQDGGHYSLFSIAHGLSLGQGVPAIVSTGTYTLKVVPSGTVTNTTQFLRAHSLIEPTIIVVKGRTRYYASIHRNNSIPGGGRFLSVPSLQPEPQPQPLSSSSRLAVCNAVTYVPLLSLLFIMLIR